MIMIKLSGKKASKWKVKRRKGHSLRILHGKLDCPLWKNAVNEGKLYHKDIFIGAHFLHGQSLVFVAFVAFVAFVIKEPQSLVKLEESMTLKWNMM